MSWFTYFQVLKRLDALETKMGTATVDISKLKTDLANLVAQETAAEATEKADLAKVSQAIADLKAQVAAGNPITQAQLDALDAQVTGVSGGITNIVSGLDAAGTDAAAADPGAGS